MALRLLHDPIERRGVLPTSILADPLDLMNGVFQPWKLAYDQVAATREADAYCLVKRPITVHDVTRVGRLPHPSDVADLREERRLAHRRAVEAAADAFVAGDQAPWHARPWDLAFREEVLFEVAGRLREATADPFLRRALERPVPVPPKEGA